MGKGLLWLACAGMLLGGIEEKIFSGHLREYVEREKTGVREELLQKAKEKDVWRKKLGEEKYLLFYIEDKSREKRVVLVDESGIGMIYMKEFVERIEAEGLRVWEERYQ